MLFQSLCQGILLLAQVLLSLQGPSGNPYMVFGLLRLLLLDLLYLSNDEDLLIDLLEPHVRHPRDLSLLVRGQPSQAIGRIFHLDVDRIDPGLVPCSDHFAIFFRGNIGESRLPLHQVVLGGDHLLV